MTLKLTVLCLSPKIKSLKIHNNFDNLFFFWVSLISDREQFLLVTLTRITLWLLLFFEKLFFFWFLFYCFLVCLGDFQVLTTKSNCGSFLLRLNFAKLSSSSFKFWEIS